MAQHTDPSAQHDAEGFFPELSHWSWSLEGLLGELSRNHDAIADLSLSLFRQRGARTAAEEYGLSPS